MIIFDLINDEAPLFIETAKMLISRNVISGDEILGVTEGNRWQKESDEIQSANRLHFFDKLDKKGVDIDYHLERISNEYDNFNIYACDRYLLKKDRNFQKKLLVYTYLFYEEIFSNDVSYYFTTGIAYTYNLVSYQVSLKHDVKHISFYGTRLVNKTAISYDIKNTFNEVLDMYKTFNKDNVTHEMRSYIEKFVNKPKQPSYMKNAINSSTINKVFIIEFFIRFGKFYFNGKHKYDLFTRNPFELSLFKLNKIVRAKQINFFHDYIFDQIDFNDNYFIFPLHMQPEASTLVLSAFYVDQKAAIINISKVLPPNTILYVKEHKSALGQHTKSFYKNLKQFPNIKLISHKENMFELIKNSRGTINLSSTVGLESLLLKKPTIVLGDVFYNDTNLTFKTKSYFELESVLKKISKEDFDLLNYFEGYQDKIAYYIFCLKTKSYPFEFNVAKLDTKERVMTKKNIVEFSTCIENLIRTS